MFKLHIAAYYYYGALEDCAYQECVVFPTGECTLIKADAKGKPAWEYGGWGKYAPSLTVVCLAIADDIVNILRRIPAKEMQATIKRARKTGSAILPVDTNVYFDPYEFNCDSYIFLDWIDDSNFPDARRPTKRYRKDPKPRPAGRIHGGARHQNTCYLDEDLNNLED